MSIYSSTYNLVKAYKDNETFECLGDIDELVSYLGLIKSLKRDLKEYNLIETDLSDESLLEGLQFCLMKLSSYLAGHKTDKILKSDVDFLKYFVEHNKIDEKSFVIPGKSQVSSYIHIARTIARRAERSLVRVLKHGSKRNASLILKHSSDNEACFDYLNLLSKVLFILAIKEKK